MARKITFKVEKNLYGNLTGYIGGRKVHAFGEDSFSAVEWLIEQQEIPNQILSEMSYFDQRCLDAHAKLINDAKLEN